MCGEREGGIEIKKGMRRVSERERRLGGRERGLWDERRAKERENDEI